MGHSDGGVAGGVVDGDVPRLPGTRRRSERSMVRWQSSWRKRFLQKGIWPQRRASPPHPAARPLRRWVGRCTPGRTVRSRRMVTANTSAARTRRWAAASLGAPMTSSMRCPTCRGTEGQQGGPKCEHGGSWRGEVRTAGVSAPGPRRGARIWRAPARARRRKFSRGSRRWDRSHRQRSARRRFSAFW